MLINLCNVDKSEYKFFNVQMYKFFWIFQNKCLTLRRFNRITLSLFYEKLTTIIYNYDKEN